jgi:hypothetical protein
MRARSLSALAIAVLTSAPIVVSGVLQEPPTVKIPEPGVPEVMTLEGAYVRAAYNNEGYAIIGYRLANMSVGEEWLLLEFGTTVRDGVPSYTMKRDALSLETPDGKKIPMASNEEYRKVDLRAMQNRERVQRDSINYFPPSASRPCRIGFFSEIESRTMAYDQVELSNTRGCVGRIFFRVPGGISYGQHWLNVQFENSLVRVPFRILTKDEEKLLTKNFKDIRRQVQDAFKPKKKT